MSIGRQAMSIYIKFISVIVVATVRGVVAFSNPHKLFHHPPLMHHHYSRVSTTITRFIHRQRNGSFKSNLHHCSNNKMPTCLYSQNPSTCAADGVSIRILCLHGKGGTGEQFVNSSLLPLRSLVDKRIKDVGCTISFQWEELTAPYEISSSSGGGWSWWTMPPGVRSYNAQQYEGFDKSEAMVMNKLYPTITNDDQDTIATCNFDIILGHSQGAILTAALLSIHEKLRSKSNGPTGYILNGVAWPNPYTNQRLETINDSSAPRMLFIMGKNDNINPIESAMQVHDAYEKAQFNASIVNHGGGHSVPIGSDDDSVRALEEVADWIVHIAKEKANNLTNSTGTG